MRIVPSAFRIDCAIYGAAVADIRRIADNGDAVGVAIEGWGIAGIGVYVNGIAVIAADAPFVPMRAARRAIGGCCAIEACILIDNAFIVLNMVAVFAHDAPFVPVRAARCADSGCCAIEACILIGIACVAVEVAAAIALDAPFVPVVAARRAISGCCAIEACILIGNT